MNTSRKDEAVTGSVSAGGNLSVRSGKDVKVEGADLSAGKDATVKADSKVELKDAISVQLVGVVIVQRVGRG